MSRAFLAAAASIMVLPLAGEAAVIANSVVIKANHDLSPAYLLIGDADGPASSVGVIKLSDYLVGKWPIVEENTQTISLLPPAVWNSSTFDGTLESLAATPGAQLTYALMGIYNIPDKQVTVSLPKSFASGVLGEKTWDDVFTSATEEQVGTALLGDNIQALQNFFVSAQLTVPFTPIDQEGQLVKFCIAADGGTVSIVTVPTTPIPEPSTFALVGLVATALILRRQQSA